MADPGPEYAGNLLAVIHRDGGHYLDHHGWRKAVDDAKRIWYDLRAENLTLGARIKELETAYGNLESAARLEAEGAGEFFIAPRSRLGFSLYCNDVFLPGADTEDVPLDKCPALLDSWNRDGWQGMVRWIAARRGALTLGAWTHEVVR
jgi:hypothetical protein